MSSGKGDRILKKTVFSVNLIFFVLISVGNFIFTGQGGIGPLSATAVKGITSGLFALLGVINLLYMALSAKEKKLSFAIPLVLGLVFATAGDIALGHGEADFVIGASLFALGHIMYLVSYCFLMRMRWQGIFFAGVIFAATAMFVLLYPDLRFELPMFRWVCLAYALIISLMMGKAISNLAHGMSTLTAILAVGSVLFFFSDLMLVFDWFVGKWDIAGDLCMATYYPAQWLLAFSVFVAAGKEN